MYKFQNILVFLLILLMDQASKFLAVAHLQMGRPKNLIPGLFDLTLVYNPGAAFGLFANLPSQTRHILLLVVTLLAFLVVIRLAMTEARGDAVWQAALSGILAGALGNVIDRCRLDSVIDFLDFYIGSYHWPAFNIADSAISVGVFAIIIKIFLGNRSKDSEVIEES